MLLRLVVNLEIYWETSTIELYNDQISFEINHFTMPNWKHSRLLSTVIYMVCKLKEVLAGYYEYLIIIITDLSMYNNAHVHSIILRRNIYNMDEKEGM